MDFEEAKLYLRVIGGDFPIPLQRAEGGHLLFGLSSRLGSENHTPVRRQQTLSDTRAYMVRLKGGRDEFLGEVDENEPDQGSDVKVGDQWNFSWLRQTPSRAISSSMNSIESALGIVSPQSSHVRDLGCGICEGGRGGLAEGDGSEAKGEEQGKRKVDGKQGKGADAGEVRPLQGDWTRSPRPSVPRSSLSWTSSGDEGGGSLSGGMAYGRSAATVDYAHCMPP